VISFFNNCITAAPNQSKLGQKELRLAEGEYSRGRFSALADEWSVDYPTLEAFAADSTTPPFVLTLRSITEREVEELCLDVVAEDPSRLGSLAAAMQVVDGMMPAAQFKLALFRCFYQVGLVGLKSTPHATVSWVDELGKAVSFAEIDDRTTAVIHPAYRRVSGTTESS
jgi:hypothetical protein